MKAIGVKSLTGSNGIFFRTAGADRGEKMTYNRGRSDRHFSNDGYFQGHVMNSFPVCPRLKGPKGHILAARIEVPILAAMIYGIVGFIRLGWSREYWLYTYAPVLGGIAASAGLFTYFFVLSVERKNSRKTLLLLLGLLPHLYSLYIMGVLGLYTIFEGVIGEFSVWSMMSGIVWVFVGFHLMYRFHLVTEIVRRHDEQAMLARPATETS
jgi:hypothetical protein